MIHQGFLNPREALYRHAENSALPEVQALALYFEPCLSCGKQFKPTGATITILCVEGRQEVAKVCATCAKRRGLA